MAADDSQITVSRYIIDRLRDAGVGHVFGVPGDYVLDFLDELSSGPLCWVGNCNELNAGYAADGYARLKGLGAVVVTYGVGGLSVLNAVAGAYAERVPLVVISGAPSTARRRSGALVHHLISDYSLQFDIFKKVTVDSAVLLDPVTAPDEIDRVMASCLAQKRPVYLELPMDISGKMCRPPSALKTAPQALSDAASLAECVAEAAEMLDWAANPVVIAGVEVLRFGLGPEVLRMVETVELPFATTLNSKCVLPELHPQFIGIYQGALSRPNVRSQVESSECLLSLGVWMTDLDTGLYSMKLDTKRLIAVGGDEVRIKNHHYHNVRLEHFIPALTNALRPRSIISSHPSGNYRPKTPFVPVDENPLTAVRLYERLNHFLDDHMVLLAEPGDAFCAAPEFHIDEADNFIVQGYYVSIGYSTPAALGVSLARPEKRPVVLTGDGAFQMTAQEVSTLIRNHCPAIVLVLNNDGYLIERLLHRDGPYNDIQNWSYHKLPEVFGGDAIGIRVSTEGELERALETAKEEKNRLVLIELCLKGRDCSLGLSRLCETFKLK